MVAMKKLTLLLFSTTVFGLTSEKPILFKEEELRIEAFCPCEKCCGKYAGAKTIFGDDPWKTPGVAANLKFLPAGTLLSIPGVGIRMVDANAGKRIMAWTIRLRMTNHEEAKKWGIKYLPIKMLGNAIAEKASIASLPHPLPANQVIYMLVTGYCPCKKCCGPSAKGITSFGKNAWITFGVAADQNLLPSDTKLMIPGTGERVVDDTGGDMRKSAKNGYCQIDVRFHSHEEAMKFDTHWLKVKILGPAI